VVRSWRLLDFGRIDICTAMAMDEAILTGVADGSSPDTIRFAQFEPPTVSLGYFQSVREEIDVDACRRLRIDLARRLIGGGAAYEDSRGELTYGICVRLPHSGIPSDLSASYEALSSGVAAGLGYLGVKATFAGLNDVVVGGRKIGGVGQCRSKDALLQEGSVLLDDMPAMFKVLKISKKKMQQKGFSNPQDRMTNIRRELGKRVDVEELKRLLIKGFEDRLPISITAGALNDKEMSQVGKLRKKYSRAEWVHRR
jgi:lipoate-protein ligase A